VHHLINGDWMSSLHEAIHAHHHFRKQRPRGPIRRDILQQPQLTWHHLRQAGMRGGNERETD